MFAIARRLRVESLRVRADHGLVEPAGAALVDRAVLVDERVVADVVPAVRVAVVAADREHDLRRLLRRVVVQRDRVVHLHRLHRCRSSGAARGTQLDGAPVLARDVRERGRSWLWAAWTLVAALPDRHEVQPQPRHAPVEPVLDRRAPGRPRPGRSRRARARPGAASAPSRLSRRTRSSTSGVARPRQCRPTRLKGRGADTLALARVGGGALEVGGLGRKRGRDEGQGAQERRC